jgi:RimJ/RimL family protein N-acetyltransferase
MFKSKILNKIGEIELGPMLLEDVHAQADYIYNSPKEFLISIGFDLSRFPSRTKFVENLESRIKAQMARPESDKNYQKIIAKLRKKPIAAVVLVPNEDESAHAHFHIWDSSLRGKGLGKDILTNGLKLLMDHQKRTSAFIEPHKENTRMNKLMAKCGFKLLGDSTFSGPVTKTFPSKKYLIERARL